MHYRRQQAAAGIDDARLNDIIDTVEEDREEGTEEVDQLLADVAARGGASVRLRKALLPAKRGDDDGSGQGGRGGRGGGGGRGRAGGRGKGGGGGGRGGRKGTGRGGGGGGADTGRGAGGGRGGRGKKTTGKKR